MSDLHLSRDLRLPLEAITETFGILGIRGSGKTSTAVVLVEELLERRQQVIVLDPTDVWWGLKSAADGSNEGYQVVVLGGRRGDLPLLPSDGATVADFLVEHRVSAVLSLRHFESDNERRRLITDFARRFYHRKGEEGRDTPCLIVIDEAHLVVPQRVSGKEAPMVGAIQRLVRQGRNQGIGVVLIDQRAASVNKDVLTQVQMLIAHRTIGKQDRTALDGWIEQHDSGNQRKAFLDTLPTLERGQAWFWSPGWLDLFKKVQVRQRKTFDSSATPKAGERRIEPKARAEVDLAALKAKMQTTIEKARADDPAELRRQMVQLQRELAGAKKAVPPGGQRSRNGPIKEVVKTVTKEVPVHVIPPGVHRFVDRVQKKIAELAAIVPELQKIAGAKALRQPSTPAPRPSAPAPRLAPTRPVADTEGLKPSKQRILDALAFLEGVGVTMADKGQLALLADAPVTSGGYKNNLGALRSEGYIDYPSPSNVALTELGRAHADVSTVPQTNAELHRAIQGRIPASRWRLLEALIEAYPEAIGREDLATRVEVPASSGGFKNNLGFLRTLGLIAYPSPGTIVACPILFLDGQP